VLNNPGWPQSAPSIGMLRVNRRINNLGYHVDQPVMTRSYGTKMLDQDPGAIDLFLLSRCYRLVPYYHRPGISCGSTRHDEVIWNEDAGSRSKARCDLFTTAVNARPHMPNLLPEQVLPTDSIHGSTPSKSKARCYRLVPYYHQRPREIALNALELLGKLLTSVLPRGR
jgi:hypothetical protein